LALSSKTATTPVEGRPSLQPACALPAEELARLAQMLKEGQVQALSPLLHMLGPRIAAGLVRRHPLLRVEDVEDVLSVASQRLWESRVAYDASKSSLAAWFFIIADNAAKDLIKKEARRLEQSADLSQVAAPEAGTEETPPAAFRKLAQLLVKLDPLDHRILWAYADAGGVGPWAADLSRELGMRPGTIRVRCQRIKDRLRKAIHAGAKV
jgi:RNA polymerase sigma factor (sigma-70 family)